jgi:hypothetical protein
MDNVQNCDSYIRCNCVGRKDLTTVIVNISMFCVLTPCSLFKLNRRFGETFHLSPDGRSEI